MAFLLGALYAHGPALPSAVWAGFGGAKPMSSAPGGSARGRATNAAGPGAAGAPLLRRGQVGRHACAGPRAGTSLEACPAEASRGPPRPGAKRQSADVGGRCKGTRSFVSMGCGRGGFDCPALSGMTSRLLELITELVKCEPA